MGKITDELVDHEWIELIVSAKKIGLTIEEIQLFLTNCSSND